MSNQLYDVAARALALGQLSWPNTELVLLAWGGVPLFDTTHASVADIRTATGESELGSSLPITESSVALDGTCQTNQVVISDIPIGPSVTWFTMCKVDPRGADFAVPILFVDNAIELPFVPNDLDLVVQPDWALQRGWFRP